MGYELDKLKNQYGVGSATSTYGGTSMPVKPVDPTTTASYKALDTAKQSDARAKYANDLATYNANLPKYQEDKALYDQYQQAYKQRLLNTNMYDPAANRQVLQQPIYSNANPDLVKQDKKFTVSKMPYQVEELPNLVSKYFNPASATTGGTGAGSSAAAAPASNLLTQTQAWDKYQADLKAQQLAAARNAVNNPVGTIEGNKTQSHYYMLTSHDPRGYNYTDYYNPSNLQSDEDLMQHVINADAKLNTNSRLLQQYSSNLKNWTEKNPFGSGAYAFAAKGGHIDLNSLAQKYADGGPVKATAEMYKAWNEDPDKAASDAALMKGDYKTAAALLQKSAAAGNANAQANLGAMYAQGLGVSRNPVEAAKLMLIAEQKGYGDTGKNSNYYWLSQNMTPEQIASAKSAANDFLNPDAAKAKAEADAKAAAEAKAAADAKAAAEAQAAAQAKAAADAKAAEEAKAAAEAKAAEEAKAAAEKQRLFDEQKAAPPVQEAVSAPVAATPATPTEVKAPAEPVHNLGEGPKTEVTNVVADAPKADDAGVAAVKNIDTGTIENAPKLGGVTMAPAQPAPNLGATPPPAVPTPVGNAPANDAVVNAIKTMPSQTMVAPAAPANPLANLYQSYQQQTAAAAPSSAQQRWQADRNNYIRSLYGLGTYSQQAIQDWEKQNQLGQGKYHYATGGAVKTNYADGDLVDLNADDTEDNTSAVVSPGAYDALLARYKDVDATELAKARAESRAKRQAILDELSTYKAEQEKVKPDKSEMYFRLAQAFLTPGKTGSFGEGLAAAGGVMADYQKDLRAQRRADAANMLQLGLKQKELMANMADEDLKDLETQQAKTDAARLQTELAKIRYGGTSSGSTVYEKQAISEGFTKGTPEFVARIKQLWSEAHQPSNPAQPAPTLATIIDPTDPSKALVVNARTYQGGGANSSGVIGTANKDSITANMSSRDIQELNASYPNLKAANDAAIAEIDKQLAAIDKLENHAGLGYITGTLAGRTDAGSLTDDGAAALQLYNTVSGKSLTQALAAARANSPSGASGYGNLTKSEGDTLRDSQATLGRAQPTDVFKENLQTYRADLQASRNALVNKFNDTYAYRSTLPSSGGAETSTNVAPSRPSNVPVGAKYSPSQKKWFWQDASGAWKSN